MVKDVRECEMVGARKALPNANNNGLTSPPDHGSKLPRRYREERTTFADGTTVTVDWDSSSYKIEPELR